MGNLALGFARPVKKSAIALPANGPGKNPIITASTNGTCEGRIEKNKSQQHGRSTAPGRTKCNRGTVLNFRWNTVAIHSEFCSANIADTSLRFNATIVQYQYSTAEYGTHNICQQPRSSPKID
mmetsp:Transcript_16108/g.34916  ORF Transcript_16108/g.34916 Transcript_16108/m.34916 type:complete len:123 (+) Transcript_16108:1228-1596(+)